MGEDLLEVGVERVLEGAEFDRGALLELQLEREVVRVLLRQLLTKALDLDFH